MAAFSYHHHQSLVLGPPAYLATTTTTTTSSSIQMALAQPTDQAGGDLTNSSLPCFPFYYSPDAISEISANDVMAHESSSSLDSATKFPSLQAVEHLPTKQHASMEKKRKGRQRFLPSPAPSIDPKEGRRRKQKKCSNELKEAEEKPPNADVEKKNKNKASQEPPTGYIHVRARRGQATDSHSLAERVRREKISERMKMLQGLVPGCDKVIGKALMLDEIINYVQSLQNQVEFLSMKLASVNPILYDFGLDLDDYMVQAQKLESMSPQVPSVQQQQTHTTHIQPTAFAETTNNYPMVDSSVPFLLHGQGPSAFPQESNGFVMPMDDQSQRILHQLHFNDMSSSFQ